MASESHRSVATDRIKLLFGHAPFVTQYADDRIMFNHGASWMPELEIWCLFKCYDHILLKHTCVYLYI